MTLAVGGTQKHNTTPPFSKIFSQTAHTIKAKFNVEPPWEGGTKVCIAGPGYMTYSGQYMLKTIKYLQNQKSYDLENWSRRMVVDLSVDHFL